MMVLYVQRTRKTITGRGQILEFPGASKTGNTNTKAAFSFAYHRRRTLFKIFQVLLRAQLKTMLFEIFCWFLLYIFNSHIKPFLPIFLRGKHNLYKISVTENEQEPGIQRALDIDTPVSGTGIN